MTRPLSLLPVAAAFLMALTSCSADPVGSADASRSGGGGGTASHVTQRAAAPGLVPLLHDRTPSRRR